MSPRILRCDPVRVTDARTTDLSLKSVFIRAKKLERQYATRLRTVARVIDHLIRGFDLLSLLGISSVQVALQEYAHRLDPWARAVGQRMISEVAARDERSWFRVAATMGRELREEIQSAPVGRVMRERLEDQVTLIKSLPLEAAERVRILANEAISDGTRADVLAKKILETGDISRARANLIARTETTRTSTELTRARAEHVGSTHFVWHTAGDYDVRPSHKKLNGTTHRWDAPPVCDPPDHRALPGCIWNCRCWAEPILPDMT